MKVLAVAMLALGAIGCLLSLVDSTGPVAFETSGHSFTMSVRMDASALLVSTPLLIGGVVLWLWAARKPPAKRSP